MPKGIKIRSWKPLYPEILEKYKSGLSPSDIAQEYNCGRTTIKNIIANQFSLRTMSEAAKLVMKSGKRDGNLKALIHASKTTNRFNPKKGVKGEKNHRWIKDRTQLKWKRNITEERDFFKEVLKERDYICQLTSSSGRMSVHHIKGVWSHPELRFDKENCIVLKYEIHKEFHRIYGFRTTEENWKEFVETKKYLDCSGVNIKKKAFVPFEDKVGKKFGRLLIMERVEGKWKCICDCGNIKYLITGNLKITKSCGCWKKEYDSIRMKNFHNNKKLIACQ